MSAHARSKRLVSDPKRRQRIDVQAGENVTRRNIVRSKDLDAPDAKESHAADEERCPERRRQDEQRENSDQRELQPRRTDGRPRPAVQATRPLRASSAHFERRSSSSGPAFVMSPAPIVTTRSPSRTTTASASASAVRRRATRVAPPRSSRRATRRGHAGDGLLARRIDLGEKHRVGPRAMRRIRARNRASA